MESGVESASEYSLWQVLKFKALMCHDKSGQLTVLVTQVEALLNNIFSLVDSSCTLVSNDSVTDNPQNEGILLPRRVSLLFGFPEGSTASISISNTFSFDNILSGQNNGSADCKIEVDPSDIKIEADDDGYVHLENGGFYPEIEKVDVKDQAYPEEKYTPSDQMVCNESTAESGAYRPDFPVDYDTYCQMKIGQLDKRCPKCSVKLKTIYGLRRHFIHKRCKKLADGIGFIKIKADDGTHTVNYFCNFPGCTKSDMKWKQKANAEMHFSEVHASPDQLEFKCNLCSKDFISRTILNLHVNSVHKREEARAAKLGPPKWKRAKTKPGAKKMTVYHSDFPIDENTFDLMKCGTLPKQCPLCNLEFHSLYGMTRHFVNHRCQQGRLGLPTTMQYEAFKDGTLGKRLKYICKEPGCPTAETGQVWRSKYCFHNHWNNQHATEEDQKIACTQCDRKFISVTLMKTHVKVGHAKDQGVVYTCSHCGKTMGSLASLKAHELVHTGTQFKCEHCSYTSIAKSYLQAHIRYMHPETINAKPMPKHHICDQCGKGFRSKGALAEHSWTHSDQPHPQFQCPICHKYMKQANSFRKHMSNVHKVNHSCKDCPKSFPTETGLIQHRTKCHGSLLVS